MAAVLSSRNCKAFATSRAQRSSLRNVVSARALVVRAQAGGDVGLSRRAALASLAGAAALAVGQTPVAFAAYGDSANVFGKTTNNKGFIPYAGDGFAVNLPSKWNPSKEREFVGTVLRYEDNFDTINSFSVISRPADKNAIADYGTPEAFLESVSWLLGRQAFEGQTVSEGGFAPDRVTAASILGIGTVEDKKGKTYYSYNILTRTADGDEGGKHQLIKATVSQGRLWLLKVQVGDKRWFKGVKKEADTIFDSFTVA